MDTYLKFVKDSDNIVQNFIKHIIYKNILFQISADLVFGHNKFHKLKELLEHHFKCKNDDRQDTRAIVFVEVCISIFHSFYT